MTEPSNRVPDGEEPSEPGGYRGSRALRVWSKVRPVVAVASWLADATQHPGLARALGGAVIAVDLTLVVARRRR